MAFKTITAKLDGFKLPLYTSPSGITGLSVTATVAKTATGSVTFNAWYRDENSLEFYVAKDIVLQDGKTYNIPLKGMALQGDHTLVVQAVSTDSTTLADIIYTVNTTDSTLYVNAPHIIGVEAFSADIGCGSCAIGGKVIEIPDFAPGNQYTINLDATAFDEGVALIDLNTLVEVRWWSSTPICHPDPLTPLPWTGREWAADVDLSSGTGQFTFTIPDPFFGFTIFAYNDDDFWYDGVCTTWDKATRTINLISF